MQDYVAPSLKETGFHCPHCGSYAFQQHRPLYAAFPGKPGVAPLKGWVGTMCARCEGVSMWLNSTLVWPPSLVGPLPHARMPVDVRSDYEEARSIAAKSPRAAAALLRLALQKLCAHLGATDRDLNAAIGSLVAKGLPPGVVTGLDIVRIAGNNAVHPGELDLRDNPEIVAKLFRLVNYIVLQMIAGPNELDELWGQMPEGPREKAEQRNAKARGEVGPK